MMSENREKIAELYFRSNTFLFGEFRLSAHLDNPELPLSPYYLHYPKPGEPGNELLPEMFELIGEEFYSICEAKLPDKPRRIAGVPKGALPLAEAHAKHYSGYPSNLVTFTKINQDGKTSFVGPNVKFAKGDELIIDDDHTSGGRNKRLMRAAALSGGLIVNTMLTVVDRQQGGVENMAKDGVALLSIFTIDKLLEFALQTSFASKSDSERVKEYMAQNQYVI
jgi:orotate phosphoribosyltransferase